MQCDAGRYRLSRVLGQFAVIPDIRGSQQVREKLKTVLSLRAEPLHYLEPRTGANAEGQGGAVLPPSVDVIARQDAVKG